MISLIVLGFNRFEEYTQPCLDSILISGDTSGFEIILVDNGSKDDSAEKSRVYCEWHPEVQFYAAADLGFAAGMNFGVGQAHGDWVVLVNNDTLFPIGSLSRWQQVLQDVPDDVGLIGPVTNAAGNGQKLELGGMTVSQILSFGETLVANPTGLLFDTYRTDFFCVAIRRKTWDMLGGLDTQFGRGYYEDFDFSLRARETGWRQVITEDIFIAHVGSASFGKILQEQKKLLRNNKRILKSLHPAVRFEHQREGNLDVLKQYLHQCTAGDCPAAYRLRLEKRLADLLKGSPRSLFKRMRWYFKCRPVRSIFRREHLIVD